MKKLLLSLLMIATLCTALVAGVPVRFNYQAVLRDAQGNVLVNQTVTIRFIFTSDPNDVSDYEEDHIVNTGPYGLINVVVGDGTPTGNAYNDTLEELYEQPEDPNSPAQKLYVQMDDGNGFTLVAVQDFASVPYALQSKFAELPWKRFGAGRYFDEGAILIGRNNRVTGSEMFGVHGDFGANSYAGMYVSTDEPTAKPFYGYSIGGFASAWHEYTGTDSTWKLHLGGNHKLKVHHTGLTGINLGSDIILSDLHILQTGGAGINEGTGGINLENGVHHWRMYNSNNLLRFNYSSDGGATYTVKSYISPIDGSFNQTSDATMKKDIVPVGSVLGLVRQLKPYHYHYIDNAPDAPLSIGFLAQDVQQLFPDFVSSEAGGNLLGIDYSKFAVVSIKAIQEQQEQIDALKAEIEELKQLIQK